MKRCLTFHLIVFLIYIMLPLWGSLQKSSDDSETIEQAIVRLIAEHNDEPNAHLGVGQSLENHKSNETIDHPESSIVPDKMSPGFGIFTVPVKKFALVESLDGYWQESVAGGGSIEWNVYGTNLSGVHMETPNAGSGELAQIMGESPGFLFNINYSIGWALDVFCGVLMEYTMNSIDQLIGIFDTPTPYTKGTLFQFQAGRVRLLWRGSLAGETSDWFNLPTDDRFYHLKMTWDPETLTLRGYVNANLIATFVLASIPDSTTSTHLIYRLRGGTGGGTNIGQLFTFTYYHGYPPLE